MKGNESVYLLELTGRQAALLSGALFHYVWNDCPEPKGIQQELLEIIRRVDDFFVLGGEGPA